MQWLVDLIIAAIGIPPCYVSRGDYTTFDYNQFDLDDDGNWHELDLSGIIPAGATAVKLHCKLRGDTIEGKLRLRPGGYVAGEVRCTLRIQVVNITVGAFITVGLSTDRKIEFEYTGADFGPRTITVQGWWL